MVYTLSIVKPGNEGVDLHSNANEVENNPNKTTNVILSIFFYS